MALKVKKQAQNDFTDPVNGPLLPRTSTNKLVPSFNSTNDGDRLKAVAQDDNKINPLMLLSDARLSGSHTSVMSLVSFLQLIFSHYHSQRTKRLWPWI